MINKEATIRWKGYNPNELSYKSKNRVWANCDGCGKGRWVYRFAYRKLCKKCCRIGHKVTDETKEKMRESHKNRPPTSEETKQKLRKINLGENNPMFGKIGANKNKKLSKETCELISKNHADVNGSNNPVWKGGITLYRNKLYKTQVYKNWRNNVFTRDNYTYQICNDNKGGNLQAHHILPCRDNLNTLLISNINNGITLCKKCHESIYKNEYNFINYFNNKIGVNI